MGQFCWLTAFVCFCFGIHSLLSFSLLFFIPFFFFFFFFFFFLLFFLGGEGRLGGGGVEGGKNDVIRPRLDIFSLNFFVVFSFVFCLLLQM